MLQVREENTGFPFNSDYPENVINAYTLFRHQGFPVASLAWRDTDSPCPLEFVIWRRNQGPGMHTTCWANVSKLRVAHSFRQREAAVTAVTACEAHHTLRISEEDSGQGCQLRSNENMLRIRFWVTKGEGKAFHRSPVSPENSGSCGRRVDNAEMRWAERTAPTAALNVRKGERSECRKQIGLWS